MASDVELLEVFRLAEVVGDVEVLTVVGDLLAGRWQSGSRFREMDQITRRSLAVQTSAATLLWAANSRLKLGLPYEALAFYNQALPICREVGDRAGEAATLTNIGSVYNGLGDRVQALAFYNQALPIRREVGDRAGEAVTRYNVAMIYRALGRLSDAVSELEIVVELDRQVQHPDLESDTATLNQIRAELVDGSGSGPRSSGPGSGDQRKRGLSGLWRKKGGRA